MVLCLKGLTIRDHALRGNAMAKELEDATSEPRGWSRVEVWLLIAISLIGLLGFMSSLSSGDVQEGTGGGDPKTASYAKP